MNDVMALHWTVEWKMKIWKWVLHGTLNWARQLFYPISSQCAKLCHSALAVTKYIYTYYFAALGSGKKKKALCCFNPQKKKFIDNTFGSFCSSVECRLDDDPIYFNCSFNSGFGFFPQHSRRVTGWNIFLSHSGFGSVCSESSDQHGIPHLVLQLHCVLFGKCVQRLCFSDVWVGGRDEFSEGDDKWGS